MITSEKETAAGRHVTPAENAAAPARRAMPVLPPQKSASLGRRAVWGLRLLLGAAAAVPVLAFMVWFNYTVDCSGLFHGDVYTREAAAMLLEGKNVDNYASMDERELSKLIVGQMEKTPDTVTLGSSRALQLTAEAAGTDDYFNFGMTAGDFYDLLGTMYLFVEKGDLPKNMILCIDPWLLNATGTADTYRSDKNLYNTFLSVCLGENVTYTQENKDDLWKALISPSYFQGNWHYYVHESRTSSKPQSVTGSAYDNNTTEIKCSDGSVHYTLAMRSRTAEDAEAEAVTMTGTLAWCDGYTQPDAERMRLLEKAIEYMQQKGVNVYIVLTPLHPFMYEYALTYPADNLGLLRSEDAVRSVAAACDTPVYGSYDPHILSGVTKDDFYDGVHCTAACIEKIWPGITQAQANRAAGIDPADSLSMTVDDDIYTQLQLRCGPDVAEQMRTLLPLTVTESGAG